ncbi:MAG: 30S ribosomal protein S2 [bacterium]|nr:30S ribosomal protein S2 [bacterium]
MVTNIVENLIVPTGDDTDIKAMIEAGVHIGHTKNKRHPAMEKNIWAVRNGISIIDLTKTRDMLAEAEAFLKNVASKNGIILFVGTRPAAKDMVKEVATTLGMPYVNERWIGGTLTNFKVISKRIEILFSLEQKQASGEFEKYTKKERILLEKNIERLRHHFDGLRLLNKAPAAMFVVNVIHDEIAIREAKRMNVPVVALVDTNANPKMITHQIPSNDDSPSVIRYMFDRIARAVGQGKAEALLPKVEMTS